VINSSGRRGVACIAFQRWLFNDIEDCAFSGGALLGEPPERPSWFSASASIAVNIAQD